MEANCSQQWLYRWSFPEMLRQTGTIPTTCPCGGRQRQDALQTNNLLPADGKALGRVGRIRWESSSKIDTAPKAVISAKRHKGNADLFGISRAGQEAPPFLAAQAAENEAIRKPRFRIAC
ncbi:hypothetical protein F2Q65_15565 [Thiohalocapsa marina]|uniref:Uncharacterized protein n=1 Tax=Thiohalocapsa marina TaxID=424902 RepID=A0A5M8FHQ5_9GAMM|nr:hypothetical protein [Thiohalocapsa marina]KAA6183480.1 hypothetical protein F2Q65_15565 [Thiohalocapsa marina]